VAAAIRPRIGLLALTLELYESLVPDLRARREQWLRRDVLPSLETLGEISFQRAVFRRSDIDAAVAGFEAAGADALLVVLLTYSPSQLALPALQRTQLPIAIWNTQELFGICDDFDTGNMIDNHGVHGTQDLANVLLRSGVKFHYITSHPSDESTQTQLGNFFVSAAAAGRLRRATIGRLGYPFPGMGDFAVDTTHMAATLGCRWVNLSLEEYIKLAAGADRQAVTDLAALYTRQYDVAPDVTDEDLRATAAVELALREMVARERLDALTYQFMAFGQDERTPTVPFVATSRLMAEGIGFAGEGDVVGAAGAALLGWLSPPASFTEVFTIDFEANGLFVSHMGEANVAMARTDRKVPLVARPEPITPTRNRQLALVTSFRPGPATLFALTQGPGGRWRFIAAAVEIADFGPLPSLCVPHSKLDVKGDVRDFLTAYANAGGPHHSAICFGDATERLEITAGLVGADYREI